MEEINSVFIGMADPSDAAVCPPTVGRLPEEMPVAMAYVPVQFWEKPYDCLTGHARGTIFPALDKPFIGEEAVTHGR